MSHAETQAKRLATRAANDPRLRKQLLAKAKEWAARAVETDAQREARIAHDGRVHDALIAKIEAKRIERDARSSDFAVQHARWLAREAHRLAQYTPTQLAERAENENRRWAERKAAQDAHPKKRKKKGSKINQERWAERAERWRLREAVAAAKREAKRKRPAPILPPLPY